MLDKIIEVLVVESSTISKGQCELLLTFRKHKIVECSIVPISFLNIVDIELA